MKAIIIHKDSDIHEDYYPFYDSFVKFLQKEYPLKMDVEIVFVQKREGKMTTGNRGKDRIKVFTKGRILRDIFRTLGHEWVHEYQMDVLKREMGPNIGGRNENEANSISAMFIKMFEEKYPEFEQQMYE